MVSEIQPFVPDIVSAIDHSVPQLVQVDSVRLHVLVFPSGEITIEEAHDTTRCSPSARERLDSTLSATYRASPDDDSLILSIPLDVIRRDFILIGHLAMTFGRQTAVFAGQTLVEQLRTRWPELCAAYLRVKNHGYAHGVKARISFKVTPNGSVQNCRITESELIDSSFEVQIIEIVKSWRFSSRPESRGVSTVTNEMDFGLCK